MNVTVPAYDAIGANEARLPDNVLVAGYDTEVGAGSGIKWSTAQYMRHLKPYPAIHIDQDPAASDPLADWLDVEPGAATENEIVGWLERAQADFVMGVRPGQRWPGLYCSESNVPSMITILENAGPRLIRPVPFWVANYSISPAEANRRVAAAMGPYPALGFQYTDQAFGGIADADIFALTWVTTYSLPMPQSPGWTDILVQNLPTLQIGNTTPNQDVRNLQALLSAWQITTVADGLFGPITEANVKRFQTAKALQANGIVGSVTWQKLLNR